MSGRADLIILGGGPAGTAAAIWAARAGLRIILLERLAFPRFRPGETLHPGVHAVLSQLGVAEVVEAASVIRPEGQIVAWAAAARYVPYGQDEYGPWRGYQIGREELDAILLGRARQLGVAVMQPLRGARPITRASRVVGVRTEGGDLAAPFVVDATGTNGWLRRALGLALVRRSPPLTAFYGYAHCSGDMTPRMDGDSDGWTWTAKVRPSLVNWCRLNFHGGRSRLAAPPSLRNYEAVGAVRAADVTWRRVLPAAGPGYVLAGDAAFILDPASSHGVLRALMSGMMAAQIVVDVLGARADAVAAATIYDAWIGAWFDHDATRLGRLYDEISPHWSRQSESLQKCAGTRSDAPPVSL